MAKLKPEWTYFDEEDGNWLPKALTLEELDQLYAKGLVHEHTYCINQRMAMRGGPLGSQGIPYSMIPRSNVDFKPSVEEFFQSRQGEIVTVFSGANNGGKSLLLKNLFLLAGHGSYLIGCNRFSNIDVLNSRQRERHEHRSLYENLIMEIERSNQNTENNHFNLEQVLTGLNNRQRTKLFDTAKSLIGNVFLMERTDPDNDFSPFHVLMDGENLRYGSAGTRLFLTICH